MAISYLKKSKKARQLIDTLEESEITFTITFTKDASSFTPDTQTININIYLGLVLIDGISTQSVAMAIAHEMGHACQYAMGIYEWLPGKGNKMNREELNLIMFETPIAKELGEPVRRRYDDNVGFRYMENPIWFITAGSHSIFFYFWPGNWGEPWEYPVYHNRGWPWQ